MKIFKLKKAQYLGPIVYIVWHNDFAIYVGYSSVGLARALDHKFLESSTHIEIRPFRFAKTAKVYEEYLIQTLQPPYNITHNFKEIPNCCKCCRKPIISGRADKSFCNSACKKRYHRRKELGIQVTELVEAAEKAAKKGALIIPNLGSS